MKNVILLSLVLALSAQLTAGIVNKAVSYRVDNMECKGYLAYDGAFAGKRPGILLAHEWWGLNDFARAQADKLAALGYTVLAVDMYGDGRSTGDPKVAQEWAGQVRGTPLMRQRIQAGLAALTQDPRVDAGRIAAVGYCFGGSAVLELAYSGARIKGVVTFHAGLTLPGPDDLARISAKFLVLHGADDPYASQDLIAQFQSSLRQAGADWQMVFYGNAVHSFTNPAAGSDKSKGAAYDPLAAERSWEHMKLFLREVL
jgi:dienelactone hydrolase